MIGSKLKQLRKELGLTQKEFSEKINISRDTYAHYEIDRRMPDYETLKAIASFCKVTVDYLLGVSNIRTSIEEVAEYAKNRGTPIDEFRDISEDETVVLPLIGTVAAGTPILAVENIEKYIAFPKPFAKNATFALRIKGNSMKGVGIQDGDIVFVKQQPDANNGQIVIAKVNDEVTCKKLLKTDSKIILLPANDEFDPIESDNVEVVGIVVSATRMF